MTPEEFQKRLKEHEVAIKELIDTVAPAIAGNTAVSFFKENFRKEGWGRTKWQEVQRRTVGTNAYKYSRKRHPARTSRKILTGDTGDLGRSIEVKKAANGQAVVWTAPNAFDSKEPYGRVHNEGLQAGRGKGFRMPKRQFMGESEELNKLIQDRITKKLNNLFK